MKQTLFISTYFNNPHFIEYQYRAFKKFVQDDYDFAIIDDSNVDAKCLLSDEASGVVIRRECAKYNIRHIPVPQSVHALVTNGGLVPLDNEFAGIHHPTVRHQAVLRWIFDNYRSLGFDQYKTLALFDADMFFKKPVHIGNYMENYDMMGSWRELTITEEHLRMNSSEEVRRMLGTKFKHFTLCLLFLNMQNVKNLETFDNASFAKVTDTGGKTKYFIENNPQYNYCYMPDTGTQEYRVDFFSTKNALQDEAEIIHYRAGSCWDYNTKDYYIQKMNRMFERFIPEFYNPSNEIKHNVISSNKEHVILPKG